MSSLLLQQKSEQTVPISLDTLYDRLNLVPVSGDLNRLAPSLGANPFVPIGSLLSMDLHGAGEPNGIVADDRCLLPLSKFGTADHSANLCASLYEFSEQRKFTDCVLICKAANCDNGTNGHNNNNIRGADDSQSAGVELDTVHVHRAVMAACSAYFEELFTSNPQPHTASTIDLSSFCTPVVRTIVELAYTGILRLRPDADLEGVRKLAKHCRIQIDGKFNRKGTERGDVNSGRAATPPAICSVYEQPEAQDNSPQAIRTRFLRQLALSCTTSPCAKLVGAGKNGASANDSIPYGASTSPNQSAAPQPTVAPVSPTVNEFRSRRTEEIIALAAAHRALVQRQINEKRVAVEEHQQQQNLLKSTNLTMLTLPIVSSGARRQDLTPYGAGTQLSPNTGVTDVSNSPIMTTHASPLSSPTKLGSGVAGNTPQSLLLAQWRQRQLLAQQLERQKASDNGNRANAIVAAAALLQQQQQNQMRESDALKREHQHHPSLQTGEPRDKMARHESQQNQLHPTVAVRQQAQPDAGAQQHGNNKGGAKGQQIDGDQGWCRNKKYIERVPSGFMCTVCGKVYGRYNSVSYHVTIYHRNPPIECAEPGCKFTTREARYIHFHRYYRHGTPLPKTIDLGSRMCAFCRHIAKSPAMLDKHIRRHFANGTNARLTQHHVPGVGAKLGAGAGANLNATQQAPMQRGNDNLCTLATAAAMSSRRGFSMPTSTQETAGSLPTSAGTVPMHSKLQFSCSICAQKFDTADMLLRHESSSHMNELYGRNGTSFDVATARLDALGGATHQCGFCEFKTRSPTVLQEHKFIKHQADILFSLTNSSISGNELTGASDATENGRKCASAGDNHHHRGMGEGEHSSINSAGGSPLTAPPPSFKSSSSSSANHLHMQNSPEEGNTCSAFPEDDSFDNSCSPPPRLSLVHENGRDSSLDDDHSQLANTSGDGDYGKTAMVDYGSV